METERKSNGALWRQNLSCASHSIRRICKTADRRIVQAHGTTDLRETIAVVEMSAANGFIPPYSVSSSPGSKQLAQRRPGCKPLSPGNLFQEALVSQPWRQPVDKALTPKQHLASQLLPRRTLADSLGHKRLILPLSGCTLQTKLRQQPVDGQIGRGHAYVNAQTAWAWLRGLSPALDPTENEDAHKNLIRSAASAFSSWRCARRGLHSLVSSVPSCTVAWRRVHARARDQTGLYGPGKTSRAIVSYWLRFKQSGASGFRMGSLTG